ncbi:MAG: metallopeptidase TldD-related protein [Blautia sp.]|nr:metallopeptidase TldD-related protein [Blautia sp.]
MDKLYEILERSGASDFLIRETTTCSREAFFIGRKLDMGRAKEVCHTFVTVYVDSEDGKFRGSATKEIHPSSTQEEIEHEIQAALFAAKFVKNPWYPVVTGTRAEVAEKSGSDLDEDLIRIIKTLQAVRTETDEKVNSCEVFVNQKKTRIRNSRGVDVSFSGSDCQTELVINVEKDGHEIELLREICFSAEDTARVTEEAKKLFLSGHDRLNAKPTTQQEHGTILLTGDDVAEFFRYFTAHSNAYNQYMGVAKARIGEKMTGEEADPLTIRLVPEMEGSTRKEPYDSDGNPVKERLLFEDGVCRNFWGSTQHAYYMKMDHTTSMNNMIVSGGDLSEAELRKIPHLEITEFSCFDMDPVSGSFGGEIRLGYESDGKKRQSVTGGSLSGNYGKILKNMKFSKETRQINNFIVPCAVLLEDVSIAGC